VGVQRCLGSTKCKMDTLIRMAKKAGFSGSQPCIRQALKETYPNALERQVKTCGTNPNCKELAENCMKEKGFVEAKTFAPTAPKRQISCEFIFGQEEYSECLTRARAGDANAAFNIAKLYDEPPSTGRLGIRKDRATAFYWYKVAAELGHNEALRTVFESYYFGTHVPKNNAEADRYLKYSAKLGHQWAILVLARWSEKEDLEKAMDLYLELALKDNCHAQRKLAKIYFEGKLVPQDLCKSYFWALLASAGGTSRFSDYHFLADLGDPYSSPLGSGVCTSVIPEKYRTEKELGPKYVRMVQDAALRLRFQGR
jgi:hypothetical protein